MISKKEAENIIDEWVNNKNLKKHMYAVAGAMEYYAKKFGVSEESDKWWVVGLLHDADYEKYPNEHPHKIIEYLDGKVDRDVIDAILGHTDIDAKRETLMAKTLFAVDELTGFIVAVALIKPSKSLDEVDVASVKKRLKEKRFAAGVDREGIIKGVEELGISLDDHIQNVIDSMLETRDYLGL